MRKLVFCIVFVLCLVNGSAQNCCNSYNVDCKNKQSCCKTDTLNKQGISPSTLIIYYSGKNKKVLKLAKKIGAEVLYTYENFNAVAIRKPENMTLDETKQKFEKLKGVLQVSYDHVYHLD